jgi:uncharacterized protein HI_0948
MSEGTVFMNNRTQAVRLPADMRFDESVKKVEVRKQGNERIISPAGQSWDSFFAKPKEQWLSDDFSVEQEAPQEREGW